MISTCIDKAIWQESWSSGHNGHGERTITGPRSSQMEDTLASEQRARGSHPDKETSNPTPHAFPERARWVAVQDRVTSGRSFGGLSLHWGVLQEPCRCGRGPMLALEDTAGSPSSRTKRAPLQRSGVGNGTRCLVPLPKMPGGPARRRGGRSKGQKLGSNWVTWVEPQTPAGPQLNLN